MEGICLVILIHNVTNNLLYNIHERLKKNTLVYIIYLQFILHFSKYFRSVPSKRLQKTLQQTKNIDDELHCAMNADAGSNKINLRKMENPMEV